MARLVFGCGAAAVAFASMAEGMQEVQADSGGTERAAALERIAQAVWQNLPDPPAACVVPLADADAEEAGAVLDNCLENTAGMTREEADEEQADDLFPCEATVEV